MRRRRLLLGAVVLAPFGLAGLLFALHLAFPEPGVTWDNFQRIQDGMSEQEVEAILGGPGKTQSGSSEDCPPQGTVKTWHGTIMEVFVVFDERGTVKGKGPS